MPKLPPSHYRCHRCSYEFEVAQPGPATCRQCGHNYLDWLNWEAVVAVARIIDGRAHLYR
jgi:rRNA maturation endonuclease Nob1